jgi:O-antigen/teichoic acid export membrane protein
MAAVYDMIPELDRKGLRKFGLMTAVILASLFGLAFPWFLDRTTPYWPWILAGALSLVALIAPNSLRAVYRLWMRFGLLLGRVTTPLILSLAFFFVLTPLSLVRRLVARDPIARTFDTELTSYRIKSEKRSAKSMERPF